MASDGQTEDSGSGSVSVGITLMLCVTLMVIAGHVRGCNADDDQASVAKYEQFEKTRQMCVQSPRTMAECAVLDKR